MDDEVSQERLTVDALFDFFILLDISDSVDGSLEQLLSVDDSATISENMESSELTVVIVGRGLS